MSSSNTSDFYRCKSDENLRYYGAETDMEALSTSMNALSIMPSVSCSALEIYAQGKSANKFIDKYLAQLTNQLQNPSAKHFFHLPLRDIQANILLVLCRYSHEQRLEDLLLLSLMLPYYISILAKNSDEFCCGIISEELVQCLDNPDNQLLYDLDLRIDNFIKKNSFYRYSKDTELEYLNKLLKKITCHYHCDIQVAFTTSLQCWVQAAAPEPTNYAAVIRRVTELTCLLNTEACPILTFFAYMHQLDVSNLFADEFLKELYTWQICEFTAGNDISAYIGCMENVLIGQERLRYTEFSSDHKFANVWLLMKGWEQTQDPRYINVLLLALPHVALYVHALMPMPTCAQILAGNIQNQKDASNVRKFSEVLVASHIHFDVEAAAEALNYYTKTVRASVEDVTAAVELFGSVLAHPFAANINFLAKTTFELLERYSQKSKDNVDIAFYVLHSLCCDAETTSAIEWAQNLKDEGVINLFVQLVNSPHFSKQTQKVLFKHLLFANSPPACLELAIRLLPSITALHVPLLLNRVNACGRGAAIDLLTKQVALVSTEVRDIIIRALEHRNPFVSLFEKSIRWDPAHPGMDFLLTFVNSKHATEVQRRELFTAFCHAKAPSHYLGFAPRVLRPSQVEELHTFTDMLIERMKEDVDCPAMVSFLGCINDGRVDWVVRNNMCIYLLNKNTPESILLLSKMSQQLTLSTLWTLLKRIDTLKPKNAQGFEFRRLALRNLLSATWYADQFQGRNAEQRQVLLDRILDASKDGTVFRLPRNWFEKRDIVLYNVTDSYAVRIPDRIRYLMRTCGLTGKKFETVASNKIAKMVEGLIASRMEGKKKAPSSYKNFVISIAAAAHYRRLDEEALRKAAIALEATSKQVQILDAAPDADIVLELGVIAARGAEVALEVEEIIDRSMSPGPESQD